MKSPLLESLLLASVESGASDLILHSGRRPMLRIEGELRAVESEAIGEDDLDALWEECAASKGDLDYDGSITATDGSRFRVNLLYQLGARAAILRRIRRNIPSLDSLGGPSDLLREWASVRAGIVIVSGPTGSGKSTTLAAVLEWINQSFARHVITIEDPVEYVFESKMSIFTQRQVGIDTPSFAEGLRRSLRQNPDVILLGEIRDAASALTAIQAAETGHLVLATLHASSCAETVERMQLLFPQAEREAVRKTLASQLLGILCQKLIVSHKNGLALLCEYFSNEGSSRKIIIEDRLTDLSDFIARGDPQSTRSFSDSLLRLVRDDRVTEAAALEIAENSQEFSRMLRGITSSTQATRRQ
ncbi:MAG: PilT/PilU family type 4a pilus ATPase [Verrucomicrobiae bacterium]